jgi:hypothetical protein
MIRCFYHKAETVIFLCVQSLCLFTSLYCTNCSTLPLATGPSTGQPTALHTSFIHLSAGLTASKRPHVMSQLRLRSPPHIAPHQHSISTTSSPRDSSPMAPSSAASPSKISPHLTPLPPPTCSRSPSLPTSQSPHRPARSITPPPQSNGALGSGPATPPHQTWQTVKKRKWAHLTPDMSQLGALAFIHLSEPV